MPAGHSLALLADVPDRKRRDSPPEVVVGCKHPVIPVAVLARRRHEIGEPVEELKRRELDAAAGPRLRGLSLPAGPDPVGRIVSRQHVTDASDPAARAAAHGESLEREGGPGAIPQEMFQTPKIARHVAVY